LIRNPVSVEALESRMCLSAAVASVTTVNILTARLDARGGGEFANHVEFHHTQAFSTSGTFSTLSYKSVEAQKFEGGRRIEHFVDRGGRPKDNSDFRPMPPMDNLIIGIGRGFVRGVIIYVGDGQMPGGATGGDSGGPNIGPSYSADPGGASDVVSPPPAYEPPVGKPVDVTPGSQQQQQDQQGSQQQHEQPSKRRTTPSVVRGEGPPESGTIQSPLVMGIRALKISADAGAPRIATTVLESGGAGSEGFFTVARFASALAGGTATLKSNFADLVVTRLSGGSEGDMFNALASMPTQVAARVEGAVVDAIVNASLPKQKFFEFTHLGSPFALLSDSMASFVEDSASLPMAVAQAPKTGPWTLTASVAIADVVLLTYMYRRNQQKNRRRQQFARAYAYQPFAG
jgi:hypothetical protein